MSSRVVLFGGGGVVDLVVLAEFFLAEYERETGVVM
jgi:hypothetical protein